MRPPPPAGNLGRAVPLGTAASPGTPVSADVSGGTLLLETRDGVIAVRMDGSFFPFAPSTAPVVVLGTRIFVKGTHSISELDPSGLPLGTVTSSNAEIRGLDFVMLPDAGFVFLDNDQDVIHLVGPDGTFQETVAMPDPIREQLQNVSGIVVGHTLIVSETGTSKRIGVDLATLDVSIFRSFDPNDGRLGAIDYAGGVYHICRSQLIQRFTEGGPVEPVGTVPAGNITGIVAVGSYLYVVVNHEGTLRRVHAETGAAELVVGDFGYPQDIEYIPVGLTP